MEYNRKRQEQLKHLKQRKELLDQIIAGLEEFAGHARAVQDAPPDLFRLNLAPAPQRLYKCADRGFKNGRVRRARRASIMGANFG